jgi:prevent-host-death family protein
MRKVSVAEAKAHFSDLVAEARRGKKILILRHGKPAAAVVPVSMLQPEEREVSPLPRMSREEALAWVERIAGDGDPTFDAAADLLAGRR